MIASALSALSALGVGAACWAAHYRYAAVRAPAVRYNPSDFNRALLPRLAALQRPYEPTPWLYNRHLQLLWVLVREAIAPPLRYERTEVLRMRDGGTTALDWLGLDAAPDAPTAVVLHSITGDAQSVRDLVLDLRRTTGWRVVVCTRRGHGGLPLTAPRFNTMGCTADFREQLERIRAQVPRSPLFGVGVSAGSALLVRYLGEEGPRSLIRAAVAHCPGYDIGVAWRRVPKFYSRLMTERLKRYFLLPNAQAFARLEGFGACLAAQDLETFHERYYGLAGCGSATDYVARSNPVAVFRDVSVPVMILNSDDDPVCVVENVLDHLETVESVPDAMLVRTARGSHCAFYEGWSAASWANRLIAQYLQAASGLLLDRDQCREGRAA